MMTYYTRVIRRSIVISAAVAAVMVAISAGVSGGKGALGALIGVAVVTVFFGISVVVVGRAAKINPQVMMAAAMVSYIVKFIGLAIVMVALAKSTAFNPRLLGLTAIVLVLTWSVSQVGGTVIGSRAKRGTRAGHVWHRSPAALGEAPSEYPHLSNVADAPSGAR